jgi:ATP-dependent RNA helicase DDX47/RRP3
MAEQGSNNNNNNNNNNNGEAIENSTGVIDTSVTFESLGLNKLLCETCEKLGYKNPTNIQREAIPVAIEGNDIIGIAETGSGKTAAFILPISHHLIERVQSGQGNAPFSAVILAPTRELAVQIHQHVNAIGSNIGVQCVLLVGGEKLLLQQTALAKRPHIVVGTPGRVGEHLKGTKGFKLHNTQFLVLDEADKTLGSEYEMELELIFAACSSKTRRTFLFSATMTKKVEKLERAHLKDPVMVQISSNKYTTVSTLKQEYLFIPEKFKEMYLAYLLNENAGKRILVFCAQNITCLVLNVMLRTLKFPAIPLSGHMHETDRIHCLRRFVSGDRPILIATDVASRGLDIPMVETVINFDIPVNPKEYVHRVGRTARIGNSGRAITFCTQYDVEYLQKIEELIEKKMDLCPTNKNDVLVLTNTVTQALEMAKRRVNDVEKGLESAAVDDEEEDIAVNTAIRALSKKRKLEKKKTQRKKGKKSSSTGDKVNVAIAPKKLK